MIFPVRLKLAISVLIAFLKRPGRKKKILKFIQKDKSLIESNFKEHKPGGKKGTVIVKCDDIGDFIIWQHCFRLIAEHASHPFVFVGNIVLKPLILNNFDFADSYIWIDKSRWNDETYRLTMYKAINSFNCETAITPLFTRNFVMDDLLIYASSAANRIAWSSDHHAYHQSIGDALFTETIKSQENIRLEYFRNTELVNSIYKTNRPFVFEALFTGFSKQNKLVITPMASMKSKSWNADKFIEVIKAVHTHFDKIILIGGKDAISNCKQIEEACKLNSLINLSGQISLNDVFPFIGEARMLLCPDTFSLHAAVHTCTNVVLLSNGTNRQRFINYAPYIKSELKIVFPPYFRINDKKIKLVYNGAEINSIKASEVVEAIIDLLKKDDFHRA